MDGHGLNAVQRRPAAVLAALAILSGTLGAGVQGPGLGTAPALGLHMPLTGVWFAVVIGFGVWRWGKRSLAAVATAIAMTWAGWEAAVNAGLQIDQGWLAATAWPDNLKTYVIGFVAGAVGALLTWAGAAAFAPAVRLMWWPLAFGAAGALLGLLLPFTNHYDNAVILLVPWQAAIAALLGLGLASARNFGVATASRDIV